MASRDRIVVKTIRVGDAGRVVGQSLKRLRHATGLTQIEIAERLGVSQAAVTKIERRGDVQVSTLQRYVEALGGCLRIDATFPSNASVMASVRQNTDGYVDDAIQFILPIFGEERLQRRDMILSVRPFFSDKIFAGVKTVELRRRFPRSISHGTIAYIYSTSPVQALVGAAEIVDVERLPVGRLWRRHGKSASIRKSDFDAYFQGLDEGYALKISDPRPFSRPLNLIELRERFGFEAPQSFLYAKPNLQKALQNEHSELFN